MDRPKLTSAEIDALLPGTSSRPDHAPIEAKDDCDSVDLPAREQLQTLLVSFAERCTSELKGPLRGETQFEFAAIHEVTSRELLARMERPTCVLVAQLTPIAERVLIELPYGAFFPLLDRLLGGGQHPCPTMRRPLTRIERRLAVRIAEPILAALSDAWSHHLAVSAQLLAVECDPRVLQLESTSQRLVMAQCHVRVPVQAGPCYVSFDREDIVRAERALRLGPHAAMIDRFPEKLEGKTEDQLTAVIGNAEVDASSVDAGTIEEGQVLWSDAASDDPVLLYQGGKLKYLAEKGLHQGKKAVRILKVIE